MKIFLATWLEDNQAITLTKAGAKNRLMSYFFLKEVPKTFIPEYVQEGKVDKK